MRRFLLLAMLVPAFGWVFWASCQSDDYRDTLPLRSFDAAPASPPDLTARVDLATPPDQGPPDLLPADGGLLDGGGSGDGGGGADGGTMDGGAMDGGAPDGGAMDGSGRD